MAIQNRAKFNPEQRAAFNQIIQAVINKTGETFFLHGLGGTGKTFLYNTLCYHLYSQGKIVIAVASSGIASLLLPGGRTSHSTFKILIIINESSLCNIIINLQLASLICAADLIIWDEAPTQHCHIHEAIDHTFQDICGNNLPFGGLTIVYGGDFQQTLPIIEKGSCPEMVDACMQ